MKIEKNKLVKGLQEIQHFTDQNSRNMRNVLIDGANQKISAISYDSYAEMFMPIKDFHLKRGQLKATEKFCLQPKYLLDIVKTVKTNIIHLKAEKFNIVSGEFYGKNLTIGDCFQEIPLHPNNKFADDSIFGHLRKVGEMEKNELRQVVSAIQVNADIPYREYVQFDLSNDRIAAMDGKRFHIVNHAWKGHGKLLVIGSLLKKMAKRDWEVFASTNDRYAVFKSGNLKIQTENDESSVKYPKYDHRLKCRMSSKVSVPTGQFRHMVNQAALMSGKEYRAAEFEFGKDIDCLLKNPQKGSYNKTGMKMSGRVDPPVSITIDLKLLKEAITNFGDKTITEIEVDQTEKFIRLSMGKFSSMVMKML